MTQFQYTINYQGDEDRGRYDYIRGMDKRNQIHTYLEVTFNQTEL